MNELDLFAAAIAVADPAERASLLDRECEHQPDLRRRIERLIDAHFKTNEFLDSPGNQPAATATHRFAAPSENSVVVGRYRLKSQIGEGGMGTVWVADQTEPVKRKVALKLIKTGMDSRSVLARFEQERQALAVMDHPNIAKVLDGGITETGQPFFVMELVAGRPLVKFCDEAKLSLRERLELFVPICQAVQHAHQKGIIHRDLKPANILVTVVDGKPTPKIIDFGVAKAVSGKLTEESLSTHFGAVVGTIEYMAPEQAGLTTEDVDTRADVYSLGVILFELLTGLRPFDSKRLRQAALDELLRIVREEEPPSLSSRLSTDESLAAAAAVRGLEPKRLLSLVKGELDWIVHRCLEKDRNRRYETANGVSRDVRRYLADEPVEARPASAGYRLRKFVRRNRVGVFLTSFVAACLVALFINDQIARRNLRFQRDRALTAEIEQGKAADNERKAKIEAQTKEAEANAVVKFFEDHVFSAARPKGQDLGQGKAVSLRDAIVASLPALDRAFADQPLVEARLRHTLAVTFSHLGDFRAAEKQFAWARSLRTEHLGPDHPDTLKCMHSLAATYDQLGRHADALKLCEETLAARKRVLPADHPQTLLSMNSLAVSYGKLGRYAAALKLLEETLEIKKRVFPPDHPDTLVSMDNLAICYEALSRHTEALKLREGTLTVRKRVLPADHPDTLLSMNNLAVSYAYLSRHTEALKLREMTLAAYKRVLPPDHPDIVMGMHNLAASYAYLGRHTDALKLREETLAASKRVLPADHSDTLRSMHNLARTYFALGRHADALKLREETLAGRKRALPTDHPDTLTSMHALALSYEAVGRHADALKLFEETLAARKRVIPDHPDVLSSTWGVASSLVKLDRGAEAVPLIDACVTRGARRAGIDPRMIPAVMDLRLRHFQKAKDPVECRATAAMWENLNRPNAASLYTAARFRAVASAVQAKAGGDDAARLAKGDADRAVEWLTKAVAAGFKDAAQMKKDTDLDPLRERVDFKKLVTELEARAKAVKPATAPLK